jgi:hypothetical protein
MICKQYGFDPIAFYNPIAFYRGQVVLDRSIRGFFPSDLFGVLAEITVPGLE